MAVTFLVLIVLLLGAAPVLAALQPLLTASAEAWAAPFGARVGGLFLRTTGLGLATALACAALGVPVALLLARRRGALAAGFATLLPLPLVLPPWMTGLAWARHVTLSGFWGAVTLLSVALWPFVTLFALRGLRAAGQAGDAATLARGRAAALLGVELPLALPSILSGMLFVFVFAVTDFGVPDFLSFNVAEPFTVLAMEIFTKWSRLEAAGEAAVVSLPAVALGVAALAAALVLERRHAGRFHGGGGRAGASRAGGPVGALALLLLAALMLQPVLELGTWALRNADPAATIASARDDLLRGVEAALGAGAIVALLGVAVARLSLRLSPRAETALLALVLLPLAAPGVLFGLGVVHFWNAPWNPLGPFLYESPLLLSLALAGRYLPLGVLATRALLARRDEGPFEAAALSGRSLAARVARIHLPLLAPALGLGLVLGYLLSLRDLDIATLVPAGNATLIRRLYGFVHTSSDDTTALLALLLVAVVIVPAAAARLFGVPGVEAGRRE